MAELYSNMDEQSEDTQKDRYLTFLIGNECYGLEIRYVTEIIGMQVITEIPELPEYVKGIINLRGKIIPVIDIRLRFHKEPQDYNDRTCIVVVDIKEISIGLIVDRVAEVLSIPEEELVEPPQINKTASNKFIHKIGKVGNDVKLLLDCEKLFTDEDFEEISQLS